MVQKNYYIMYHIVYTIFPTLCIFNIRLNSIVNIIILWFLYEWYFDYWYQTYLCRFIHQNMSLCYFKTRHWLNILSIFVSERSFYHLRLGYKVGQFYKHNLIKNYRFFRSYLRHIFLRVCPGIKIRSKEIEIKMSFEFKCHPNLRHLCHQKTL